MAATDHATNGFIGNTAAAARLGKRARGAGGHAYLLTGPAGVGKRTLAERFAAALLCTEPSANGEPCERCTSCKLRAAGNHPDYHRLSEEGSPTIAQVRELAAALTLTPHSGRHQVGVIAGAERLGVPAQNALLKLLEEPPGKAVLVLTATSPAALLPTTVSRCQRVPLGPVTADELKQGLTARGVSAAQSADLASQASARPGQAIRLAEDPAAATELAETDRTLLSAVGADVPTRLALAKTLADDPEALASQLDRWTQLYRESLREQPAGSAGALAEALPLAKRIDGLIRLFAARRKLRYNPNTQLLLEQLLLNLAE